MIQFITFKSNINQLTLPNITRVAIVLLLFISGSVWAQNPGGVAEPAICIRADKDVKSADYTFANVPAANPTTNKFIAVTSSDNSLLTSSGSCSYSYNTAGGYIIMHVGTNQSFIAVATKGWYNSQIGPNNITVKYALDANLKSFMAVSDFDANYNKNNLVFSTFTSVTAKFILKATLVTASNRRRSPEPVGG